MARKHLSPEHFPTVYEDGQPIAVLVDLPTFQALVSAAERLDELDMADEPWIREVVERVRLSPTAPRRADDLRYAGSGAGRAGCAG
jgi:hypothetical protein